MNFTQNKQDDSVPAAKKEYQPPQLSVYGDLRELTKNPLSRTHADNTPGEHRS